MLLQGSIQRFGLAGVLQFLALCRATGVLEIRDFEEYGFVYIVDGNVEGISLPVTDEKLGTKLVKAGCLSECELAQVLVQDLSLSYDERKLKPLGQRLIDKGLADEETIREVMNRQVHDQVLELAQWTNGVFLYDEPEDMPKFDAKIEGNVQQLLLDAHRRIDEGERARKAATLVDNEVCFGCPLVEVCTPDIRTKYLRQDLCLWRTMSAVVDEKNGGSKDSRELYRSEEDFKGPTLDVYLQPK